MLHTNKHIAIYIVLGFTVQRMSMSPSKISDCFHLAKFHCILFKAAESVSFRNYCMWIFLFHKKLHMTKLFIKVELIP